MKLLEEAIELDRAAKGTIQAFDPRTDSLRIVANGGFNERFLRHFEIVRRFDSSACGRSLGSGAFVMIPDVMTDEAFRPNRDVLVANGIKSVKSIPVIDFDGQVQGVLSTHSSSVRWDWQRDNTRHLAAEIAQILQEMHPASKTA